MIICKLCGNEVIKREFTDDTTWWCQKHGIVTYVKEIPEEIIKEDTKLNKENDYECS